MEATGNATHLGKFTLDIPHVVNRANGTAIGSYEFTAANGDTLFADFTGIATPTATPGVLYIEETATITGGTGRFADATGSFTVEQCGSEHRRADHYPRAWLLAGRRHPERRAALYDASCRTMWSSASRVCVSPVPPVSTLGGRI